MGAPRDDWNDVDGGDDDDGSDDDDERGESHMKKPIELQRDAKFRRAAKNWTKKVAIVPAARDDDHDGGHDDHGD